MNRPFIGGALLCAAMVTPFSWAQSDHAHGAPRSQDKPSASPTPSEPAEARPSTANTRSMATYRAYSEPAVAPWRQSNEQVAKVGGWRTYARESQAPAGHAASTPHAPSTASEPKSKPQPPHGGHVH